MITKETKILLFICFFMPIFYLIAIADLEAGYYTFVRITSLLLLSVFMYYYYKKIKSIASPILLITAIIAILFNPIIPIYLEKETWIVFDILASAFFIMVGVLLLSKISKGKNIGKNIESKSIENTSTDSTNNSENIQSNYNSNIDNSENNNKTSEPKISERMMSEHFDLYLSKCYEKSYDIFLKYCKEVHIITFFKGTYESIDYYMGDYFFEFSTVDKSNFFKMVVEIYANVFFKTQIPFPFPHKLFHDFVKKEQAITDRLFFNYFYESLKVPEEVIKRDFRHFVLNTASIIILETILDELINNNTGLLKNKAISKSYDVREYLTEDGISLVNLSSAFLLTMPEDQKKQYSDKFSEVLNLLNRVRGY